VPNPDDCYVYTKFGVDSSSLFPFETRTHRQTHEVTDTIDHPAHGSATANVVNDLPPGHFLRAQFTTSYTSNRIDVQ